MNRLFEVTDGGFLREVAESARGARRHASVNMTIDILLTNAEEATRDLDERTDAEKRAARELIDRAKEAERQLALAKIAQLGLTEADLHALLR